MKTIATIFLFVLFSNIAISQTHEIAQTTGTVYSLKFDKAEFETIFAAQVAPYINPASEQQYFFDDILIDDPYPADSSSDAYIVLQAHSATEKVSIGLILNKTILSSNNIKLFLTDTTMARAADWKCTSTSQDCGGCNRIRANGHVVGCKCINNQTLYCGFEVTGGNGGNFPSWITSNILALIGLL